MNNFIEMLSTGQIDNCASMLSNMNVFVGMLICLLGGIMASFTPCSMTSVSMVIGYISQNKDKKNNIKYSILFALGTIISFLIIGAISITIGRKINIYSKIINLILGVILILVSLNLFGVIGKEKTSCKIPKRNTNILKAFALGIVGGLISSPCTAPILIAILTFAMMQNNFVNGMLFLLAYSIGQSIIIILAGTSVSAINKIANSEKYAKIGKILKIVFGILVLILALYYLYLFF